MGSLHGDSPLASAHPTNLHRRHKENGKTFGGLRSASPTLQFWWAVPTLQREMPMVGCAALHPPYGVSLVRGALLEVGEGEAVGFFAGLEAGGDFPGVEVDYGDDVGVGVGDVQ